MFGRTKRGLVKSIRIRSPQRLLTPQIRSNSNRTKDSALRCKVRVEALGSDSRACPQGHEKNVEIKQNGGTAATKTLTVRGTLRHSAPAPVNTLYAFRATPSDKCT